MPLSRILTIVAQDPSLTVGGEGRILTARVPVPYEALEEGPRGYRVFVLDYDASTDTLYKPLEQSKYDNRDEDPFAEADNEVILGDPHFHAQNVYVIVMRTLARFERALGRRISWGFGGHQLFVAPHAFADANAFYSDESRALLFGYFPSPSTEKLVFACLSHDVIVHETCHALLDGLRERYTDPSSPDQAGFHEGFADVVALLSAFAIPEVVDAALKKGKRRSAEVDRKSLQLESLRANILTGLAEQMGEELSGVRGRPLRRSAELAPSREYIDDPEFEEPHRRGEIFVAAMMDAFLRVLAKAFDSLGDRVSGGPSPKGRLDRARVVQEAADVADRLLNICIRAIDYTPPIHLRFGDFLSAVLTSDFVIVPDDSRYGFRKALRESFDAYGIPRVNGVLGDEGGYWKAIGEELDYSKVHLESMQNDYDEVFRFIWENRCKLGIEPDAYTEVLSVRPCRRIGPDGFILHETVAEYRQILNLTARELASIGVEKPEGMSATQEINLYGGGTLIFDEYCRLKYHVNNLVNAPAQSRRLSDLWRFGHFSEGGSARRKFSAIHLQRMSSWPLGVRATEEI